MIALGMYIAAMKHEPPATDFEYHLGYWLRFVSNHVSHAFRDRIAAFDVTVAEWVALRSLHNRAPCTLKQLAEQIGIDAGATSRLAERLIRKGLASRKEGATDRRAIALDLTAAGRSLVRKIGREADRNDAAFFGHLPRSDQDGLLRILQGLVATHRLIEKPTT
jgi:DNA-binding MarR family transcriptional regulator